MFFSRIRPDQRKLFAALFAAAILAGAVIRINTLRVPTERTEDERTYAFYASNISAQGPSATRILVEGFNSRSNMWSFPPPIRIGYLYPAAFVMKMTGITGPEALAGMSCAVSILTLILLAVAGLRFLNPWIALIAVAFLAVSPMELAIARRAWQESMVGFFGLLLIYLCCEISMRPKKWSLYAPFWILGGYSLLIKESSLVIYGLCVVWIMSVLAVREKDMPRSLKVAAISSITAGISYTFLFRAVGGAGKIVETLSNTASSLSQNAYVLMVQRGPWYYAWEAFGLLTPVTTVFAVTGMIQAAVSTRFDGIVDRQKEGEPVFVYTMLFFLVTLTVMSAIPEYLKNIRFVSVMYYPFYAISALGLWRTGRFIHEKIKLIPFPVIVSAGAIMVCLVSAMDLAAFNFTFVKHDVKDPVNPLLRYYSRYIFPRSTEQSP